jgi:hypothetical protein
MVAKFQFVTLPLYKVHKIIARWGGSICSSASSNFSPENLQRGFGLNFMFWVYDKSCLGNLNLVLIGPICKGKKGKVVPVLFLTKHHAMKAYWGSGCIAPLIL